jgi:hypothetical protein
MNDLQKISNMLQLITNGDTLHNTLQNLCMLKHIKNVHNILEDKSTLHGSTLCKYCKKNIPAKVNSLNNIMHYESKNKCKISKNNSFTVTNTNTVKTNNFTNNLATTF